MYGEATLASDRVVSEVVPLAKRDLKAGESIGEIGGEEMYSMIYTYAEARANKGVPTGLAPGAKVLKDVRRDEMLTEDNIAPDTTNMVYKLRQMPDALLMPS